MPAKLNLIGHTYGRLFVFAEAPPSFAGGNPRRRSWVRCRCGNELIAHNSHLTGGHTTSCGCFFRERLVKHALSRSRIYKIRQGMIQRCTNPKGEQFYLYGGRGITVCDRWMLSFEAFLDDMGQGKRGWTLERVNNDGNYEPGNCVWATNAHQQRNKRTNHIVTFRGKTACVTELAELYGAVDRTVILVRLNLGWDVDRAFTAPKGSRKHPPCSGA